MRNKIELPKDWKWAKLGEVATYLNGRAFKPTEWKEIGKPIIRIQNLNRPDAKYNYTKDQFEERYKVVKGDLLFAWSASLGAYIWKGDEAWLNQHIFKVVPEDFTDKTYLFYLLEKIVQELYAKAHGSGMVHVTKGKFEATEIPFPSKVTQQAIVSKIEELFSELDKGIESLRIAQQQLKTYRQSVLKWAFEGKLTNENVKEGELPKGWRIEKLGDVSEMCLGKMLDRQKNKGVSMPYLGNINVRWGEFRLDELKQMPFENEELDRFSLKKGDLVICEGGEPGRCAVWKNDSLRMMIQKALHRVRVSNDIDVRYVYYYLTYSSMIGTLTKYFTGTTIKHLTGKELRKIQIPMTLIEEQQQIVQEIESRLSVADKMDESITQSLQQAEALRQSILKKAFEGSLV